MPPPRLGAWVLSGVTLLVAFGTGLISCFFGTLLIAEFAFVDIPYGGPRSLYAMVLALAAGFIGLVVMSVAVVAGDRLGSLWHGRPSVHPRLRLRTLIASVAALAWFFGLLAFAGGPRILSSDGTFPSGLEPEVLCRRSSPLAPRAS